MTNMEIPTFGTKDPAKEYHLRLAAYIIIANQDQSKLLLVQAPNGAYFLPGGEIEANETKEEAIHREVMEELGAAVEIGGFLGRADEYFYSNHRQRAFHNPGFFYQAHTWEKKCAPLETVNRLEWFPLEIGKNRLKRGSHRWAVEQWEKKL